MLGLQAVQASEMSRQPAGEMKGTMMTLRHRLAHLIETRYWGWIGGRNTFPRRYAEYLLNRLSGGC